MLSIVIPCFNEEEAIPRVLPQLMDAQALFKKSLRWNVEICVVNDGSTDRSAELLAQWPVTLINSRQRSGYGAAIKKGIEQCQGSWVGVMDMDGTYDPMEYLRLFQALDTEQEWMVSGDRLGRISEIPLLRRVGNELYRVFLRLLFGQWVADPCSGMRVFNRQRALDILHLLPNDLSFTLALTAHHLSQAQSFREIEISYDQRIGFSKLKPFRDGVAFLKTILVVFIWGQDRSAVRAKALDR